MPEPCRPGRPASWTCANRAGGGACSCRGTGKQTHQFIADHRLQRVRTGTREQGAVKPGAQPDDVCCCRQSGFEVGTHVVDLPFDHIARHRAFGPALGYHGSQPHTRPRKQGSFRFLACWDSERPRSAAVERATVQNKMGRSGQFVTGQHSLELASRFQPLQSGTINRPRAIDMNRGLRPPDACGPWRGAH